MNLNNLAMKNPQEILGMGGPWIGEMYLGERLISEDVVALNYIYSEQFEAVFYVKCHVRSRYGGFKIHFYKIRDGVSFEFSREFDAVYLGKFISSTKIEIYTAFHDKIDAYKQIFNTNEEEFEIEK